MKKCPLPEVVLTRFGWCHYYGFEHEADVKIAGPQSSLTFYAAYNTTDATTGTLQYVDGMTIFYCDGLHDNLGLTRL